MLRRSSPLRIAQIKRAYEVAEPETIDTNVLRHVRVGDQATYQGWIILCISLNFMRPMLSFSTIEK